MRCLDVMAICHVGVMTGFLVIAGFVMLRCRAVVLRGFFVMLGGFAVVFCGCLGHGCNLHMEAYRPRVTRISPAREQPVFNS